ncbi:Uma2 family endonuclease [Sorangium sp. So ce1389]|uniref:Uma2 family endonuclease n=1 Tax=Sorangium sp. So ce1389 TaxID=3133336 RepID=UPI003F5E8D45
MSTGVLPRNLDPDRNAPEVEAAFEAVPPEQVAEILDGELFTFPRPGRPHTRSASRLTMKLGSAFDLGDGGPGGWVLLDEPELHLGPRPDKVVPDLAGWKRERMPDALGDEDTPAHYDVSPDWVCEVISPRTERVDRGKKMRIYRREGVGHVWLLSPLLRTLEVYRLEGGRWVLLETYEEDAKVRAEPFDAVELDLAAIWIR